MESDSSVQRMLCSLCASARVFLAGNTVYWIKTRKKVTDPEFSAVKSSNSSIRPCYMLLIENFYIYGTRGVDLDGAAARDVLHGCD